MRVEIVQYILPAKTENGRKMPADIASDFWPVTSQAGSS
jgi:hypothetical protein